jgi:hypothetical protein
MFNKSLANTHDIIAKYKRRQCIAIGRSRDPQEPNISDVFNVHAKLNDGDKLVNKVGTTLKDSKILLDCITRLEKDQISMSREGSHQHV